MKRIILVLLSFLPTFVAASPQLHWQWQSTNDSECCFQILRTETPLGIEVSDYSILVAYAWNSKDLGRYSEDLASWETKLTASLRESKVGYHVATVSEPSEVCYLFYVSDLDAFRGLSYAAGELDIHAELDFHFSRDVNWEEWQQLRSPNDSTNHYLVLLEEE